MNNSALSAWPDCSQGVVCAGYVGTAVFGKLALDKNLEASLRITLVYAVIAALWIFFSDLVVAGLGFGSKDISMLQTLKGWLFVAVTALILFILVFRSHQRIQQIFQLDTLTGLSNHYMFKVQLGRKLAECPAGHYVLVCFLDIDDFKLLNQRQGFERADHFLISLAEDLVSRSPAGTLVGRFPPDQFAVAISVPTRGDIESSLVGLQRIYRNIASAQEIPNTCSIGVAVFPDDGKYAEACMDAANEAQVRAKLDSSKLVFHDPQLSEESARRDELLKDLIQALSERTLKLVYQPKINLATMQVTGVEVLIRWYHPYHGMIAPDQFIPLAEEHGLSSDITYFVFTKMVEELGDMPQLGDEIQHIAINVSAAEFNRPQVMEELLALISSEPEMAGYIQLEITETATLNDMAASAAVIAKCRDAGVRISIDDFGTGYTSLAMLKDLTVDELKIDRSFVSGLAEGGRSETIVRAILAMAEAFSINVVAEGVETEEQLQILKSLRCQQVQGYLLGAPMKKDALSAFFNEREEA